MMFSDGGVDCQIIQQRNLLLEDTTNCEKGSRVMGLPRRSLPTQGKAKEILKDGTVRGKAITTKQRGLMGIIASGKYPKKVRK